MNIFWSHHNLVIYFIFIQTIFHLLFLIHNNLKNNIIKLNQTNINLNIFLLAIQQF
jgi:hypothetical protein